MDMNKAILFLKKTFPQEDFVIEHSFKILHHEWAGDGWGWIISNGKERKILMTNHSTFYIATERELALHTQELADALSEMLKARQLLYT